MRSNAFRFSDRFRRLFGIAQQVSLDAIPAVHPTVNVGDFEANAPLIVRENWLSGPATFVQFPQTTEQPGYIGLTQRVDNVGAGVLAIHAVVPANHPFEGSIRFAALGPGWWGVFDLYVRELAGGARRGDLMQTNEYQAVTNDSLEVRIPLQQWPYDVQIVARCTAASGAQWTSNGRFRVFPSIA